MLIICFTGSTAHQARQRKFFIGWLQKVKSIALFMNKLDPPKVYITLEMQIRAEALKNTAEAGTCVESRSEAQRILEEAAMIATKRMQDGAEKGS